MQGLIYEESTFWTFALVSILIGGWLAWMTGRALALDWRPYWQALPCFLLITAGVRFLHFAIFGGTFLSAHYYLVDLIVATAIGSLGYRYTLTRLMTRQYRWLYERASPFTWRDRNNAV